MTIEYANDPKNVQANRTVHVVLNCYSRPGNMPKIIEAWRNQTVPSFISVVDNRPDGGIRSMMYPAKEVRTGDDVWRMITNLGCPCHFYPALAHPRFGYTIFPDDDLIPGPAAIQTLLDVALLLGDKFSAIGQVGRLIDRSREKGSRYTAGGRTTSPIRRSTGPVPVDLTCRVKMVRTQFLPDVFTFRRDVLALGGEAPRLCGVHDDMLLDFGIQRATGWPSYVIPTVPPDGQLIINDLDDDKATWRKPGHFIDRNAMVDLCLSAGWRPVVGVSEVVLP
jgi:hypothetical protein